MKKLIYILLFLLFAANLAAQENYVIDSVCVGTTEIYKIGTTFKGSTWEWILKDTLGNEIERPTGTGNWVEISPGDTLWESRINILWDKTGVFELSVLHFSSHGCDSLEQGRVKVFPLPKAYAGNDMIICVTDPFTLTTDTAANYASLLWKTLGDGSFTNETQLNPTYNPGINDNISGSVVLVLTVNGLAGNKTCIPAVDTVIIQFGNPVLTLSSDDLLCHNVNTGSIKVTVTGGIAPYIYSWTGPGTYTANSDSIFGLAAGIYKVTVTDNIGCVVSGSVEVKQPDKLIAAIAAGKSMVCFGDSIKLNGKQTGGTVDYTQLWNGNGAVYLSADYIVTPTFKNAPAGLYELIYTVTDAHGCSAADSLFITVNPVYNDTIPLTVCEDLLPYAWRGQLLNIPGFYSDTLSNIHSCDSILTLNFNYWPVTRDTLPLAVCEDVLPYNWRGQMLSIPGFYSDTLSSIHSCDSILTVNFNSWPVTRDTLLLAVCENELPYNWRGQMLSIAGFYSDTLSSIHSCDSILTVSFNYWPEFRDTIPLTICETSLPYLWESLSLPSAGTYSDTLASASGCDSVLTIILKTVPEFRDTIPATVCENLLPYSWQGQLLSIAGFYSDTLASVSGCDSILTLELEIAPLFRDTIPLTVCENILPYNWRGQMLSIAGFYSDTLSSIHRCDSILTVNFNYWPEFRDTIPLTICETSLPYLWENLILTAAGTYSDTLASASGCDSVLTIILKTVPEFRDTIPMTVCENELPYLWESFSLTSAGTYSDTLISVSGCDSILTLNLTVFPLTSGITDTTIFEAELPFIWNGNSYNRDGTYPIKLINVYGCDSLLILNLNIIYNIVVTDTAICVQDLPLIWNGNEYYAEGIFVDTLVSVSGADSIVKLNIIINPEIKPVFEQLGPYCQFCVPGILPLISQNGITGAWSPSAINTSDSGIKVLTFTPDPGQCAATATMEIEIIEQLEVSVTIAADQTEICEGGSVTLTATSVNEGASPVYAWFVNGKEVAEAIWATYTYSPQSGDVVYAILASSLTNVAKNPVTSNEIMIIIRNDLPVRVNIFADKTVACDGDIVTFTSASFNGGLSPEFAWFVNGIEIPGETSATFAYLPKNRDLVHVRLTSDLSCAFGNPAISNKIPIRVNDNASVSVTIDADKTDICEGEFVTLTALPQNGGPNPVYSWFVNKIEVPGETSNTFTYQPKDKDAIYTVLTSGLLCTTGATQFSNIKRINVTKGNPVSVSLVADKTEICEGEIVTYTASAINGGANPGYTWFVNDVAVAGETSAVFTYPPLKGDEVYVRLASDVQCPLGNPANSNKISIIVNDKQPVSVSLVADKNFICDGATVIFTATPENGGTNPVFTWYVNNIQVPEATSGNHAYQPKNGDVVHVMLSSESDCIKDNPADSNPITITITSELPVSVSIIADKTEICEAEKVTYKATPVNDGASPVYAWFVNGKEIAGETKVTFTYSPKKGDEVYAVLTSDLGCVSGNPATSNKISVIVNDKLPVSVSVTADKTEICKGEKVTFTATPVNGGKKPDYEWFVNGKAVGGKPGPLHTYKPDEGDEIYVKLTSGETCVTNPVALSDTIKIKYTDGLLVKVDIKADVTIICSGETVHFTATPVNGGSNPDYTWFVNGKKVNGVSGDVFAYKPADKDGIYVKLTSGEFCVIDKDAISDTITITMTDRLKVDVDIAADKTAICNGETVNFTALPVNGGANPVYAWFVNGKEIAGEKGDNFAYKPANGDKIDVKLTSGETCVVNPVALSAPVVITVSDNLIVSVTIPEQKQICAGEPVTLTAIPVNGGSNPLYAWFVNKVKIAGVNKNTFTYVPNNNDEVFVTLESDLTCVAQKTASSNVVVISIGDTIPPVAICKNINLYLDADGKAQLTAVQINNNSEDNCKPDTMYLSRYNFGCADVGKNPVKLTAVDAVGLSNFCVATVTVIDTVSPVAKCVAPFPIQLDQNAEYAITVDQINAGSSDNCGIDTLYLDIYNLTCDHIGLTPITLTAVDVNGNKSFCTTNVTIYGNIAPNVLNDSDTTFENVPIVINVVGNDYDEKTFIDVSSLSISIKPKYGSVSINPVNGDLTYTPNKDFTGVDILQYRICDDGIPCAPECGKAFVYITVIPVNEPPVTSDDFYSTGCISVSRNVLDNDVASNTDLTINTNPVTPPNHGKVIIDPDGTISYFPNEGFIGIDSFEYVVCNNGIPSLCDTAKVYIKVDCNEVNPNPLECELFIPEGFSPSGDGILDFFRIWCIEHYPNAKLMIFNRNGNLLWQKEHYGNYDYWGDQYNAWWWGTSVLSKFDVGRQMINGEPKLKVGNYVYVLQLGDGIVKNGTVMISY